MCAAALLAGACTGDDDEAGNGSATSSSPIAATINDVPVTDEQVEELVRETGYLDMMNLEDPGGELRGTDVGRIALADLLDEIAVSEALDDLDLEVTDEARAAAEEAATSDPDAAPEEGEGLADESEVSVHGDEDDSDDESPDESGSERPDPRLITALAEYVTLGAWMTEPANAASAAESLFDRFNRLAAQTCGEAVAVTTTAAETTRERLAAGWSMADVASGDDLVASTVDGSLESCISESAMPPEVYETISLSAIGGIGEVAANSSTTGELVTLFVAPRERSLMIDDDRQTAVDELANRLGETGLTAWFEVVHTQEDVEIDPEWGAWDPGSGVVPAEQEVDTFLVTDTTTTTTTTTTMAPAPTAPTALPATDSQGVQQVFGSGDPGTADPLARADAALVAGVPGGWRGAVPLQISEISGSASYSYPSGRLEMGSYHLEGDWNRLVAITAHEFGHHIAFHWGTQVELGAAPEGWPPSGSVPVERWADCVSRSFTGTPLGSHSMGPCEGASYDFAASWLAPGPDAHPRTG